MKKGLKFALFLPILLIFSGCGSVSNYYNFNNSSSTNQNVTSTAGQQGTVSTTPDNTDPLLKQLTNDWKNDQELMANSREIMYAFPHSFDNGTNDTSTYVPSYFQHIISIPFHNSNKILRVYLGCLSGQENVCLNWEVRLVTYDPQNNSNEFLGKIHDVSMTGNSGALYLPYALTKDDSKVILDAWMGSPGAGGGDVDYGYAAIPVKQAPNNDYVISDFPQIATRSAIFYDSFGKVVYVDEGNNTPHYSMPGPSNDGAIVFQNLVGNVPLQKILEETDTSYSLIRLDEKKGILSVNVTKYQFSTKCPREEDGQFCAGKTVTVRSIMVP